MLCCFFLFERELEYTHIVWVSVFSQTNKNTENSTNKHARYLHDKGNLGRLPLPNFHRHILHLISWRVLPPPRWSRKAFCSFLCLPANVCVCLREGVTHSLIRERGRGRGGGKKENIPKSQLTFHCGPPYPNECIFLRLWT